MIERFLCCFFLLLFPLFIFAQNSDDDASKTKQQRQAALVEQILGDITNLKLAENRALVYVKVGNLTWKTDEKRARTLFQTSIGELINAQTLAEADKKNAIYQNELLTGQMTRPQILNTIASRDAELALEYLYKTRPAAILKALSAPPAAVKNSKIGNSSNNYSYLAQNEINLEQSFIRMAADQNPERAVKLLKESLKKGLSGETLNLLKKLHEKDADAADALATEIVGKLVQSNFIKENQPDSQAINAAVLFLNEFIREKPATEKGLKFDDSQMRKLADKVVNFYLQQNNRYGYYDVQSILPIAEKLTPASVVKLKQMPKNNWRHGGIDYGYDPEVSKFLNGEGSTPEKILAEAGKFPANSRRQIYQTAANKFAQQGDFSRATEVLSDNFTDDALEEAMRNLNWQYSYKLISDGKFAEAERMIDELPENGRGNALINLANAIYQKNPAENKSYAVAILGKARALISDKPENSGEMQNLMQIINAYSTVEPSEAFRLFEPLIGQMNELSDAAAIINGFQGNSNVRQGEFLMTNGYSWGFYVGDFSVFSKLATTDSDRTTNLINGFTRREIRISLKMQLAENLN